MERNAEATEGPPFVLTGIRYRNFENTSITERMYVIIVVFIVDLYIQQIALPHVHHVSHGIGITSGTLPHGSVKGIGILFI